MSKVKRNNVPQSAGRWPVSMHCFSCGCKTWFFILIGYDVKKFENRAEDLNEWLFRVLHSEGLEVV